MACEPDSVPREPHDRKHQKIALHKCWTLEDILINHRQEFVMRTKATTTRRLLCIMFVRGRILGLKIR